MNARTFYRNIVPFLLIIFLVLLFGSLSPNFLTRGNFITIIKDLPVPLMLAIGVTLVALVGSIDISYAGTVSLTAVLVATYLPIFGLGSALIAPLVVLSVGILNGL